MNDKERIRFLEEQVAYLKEEKIIWLNSLEMAVTLANFGISLNRLEDHLPILRETVSKVRSLIRFKAVSFYLVDEKDASFNAVFCDPVAYSRRIQDEVDVLVEDFTFSWAIERNKAVIVSSRLGEGHLLLHAMATQSRVRGMFIGILDQEKESLFDTVFPLLTIIMFTAAHLLESFELYRQIRAINQNLEETVAERTRELVESNLKLKKEILERKQAEEERIRLSTAIEQAAESVMITDSRGLIQYVNPAFEEISGYSREEVIDRNPRILSSGKHDREFYRTLWETVVSGKVWKGHLVNKRRDGSQYEVKATISPVRNHQGWVEYFVSVSRDVTNEMELEMQLRRVQKMEALGTLAGGIAHDFNNILFPILGYTQMTLEKMPPGSVARNNLEQIFKAAVRAKNLVEQILSFSRRKEHERKPLQIQPVVKETLKLLRASLPSYIAIEQNMSEDCGCIVADPTQMHQVVMNLCTNAYHAMRDEGGVLRVDVAEAELDDKDIVSKAKIKPGRYVRLTVSDTGEGMDRRIVERIFDPFFTTKEQGEGTGMGLAVVHGIVSDHGGHITVYSEKGEGAVFNVYLPVAPFARGGGESSEARTLQGDDEHILVVDDEEQVTEMLGEMLRGIGYRVTSAPGSFEALKLFQAGPEDYDLVITDYTMPGMPGGKLAGKLLEIRPEIPIILCTGFGELIPRERLKALGIRHLVRKPVLLADMAAVIRRVLEAS